MWRTLPTPDLCITPRAAALSPRRHVVQGRPCKNSCAVRSKMPSMTAATLALSSDSQELRLMAFWVLLVLSNRWPLMKTWQLETLLRVRLSPDQSASVMISITSQGICCLIWPDPRTGMSRHTQ